jgi:3-oxoacyl-[acyl-carrier protein] reductase
MDLGLKGKNAIVTGGAGGVGSAICELLAAEGANVAVSDIDLARAEAVAERCRALGVKAAAVKTDLTKSEECAALVDRTEELFGSADILVNNAGLWPTNLVTDIGLDEWRRTIDINLTAVFLASQRFVQLALGKGRKGKILNVTSQAAFNGSTTGHAHYAAAKSGVVTFTISLSREVAAKGINVNAIALGMVETPMSSDALKADRAYYEKRIQIGRVAQPIEVARLAVFLVSGAADYFTGATFDASGGMIAR